MENKAPEKSKPVLLFHISQSLFRNKRLKRKRLSSKLKKKTPRKRPKPKSKANNSLNGGFPSPNLAALFSETIEIISSEDEETASPQQKQIQQQQQLQSPSPNKTLPEVETSIVLSSDNEDEVATQARIFPMLNSQTTVQTEVGNSIFELSLTQLKENLQAMTKKRKRHRDRKRLVAKRLNHSNLSGDLSISLLSDDEDGGEDGHGHEPDNSNLEIIPGTMKAV